MITLVQFVHWFGPHRDFWLNPDPLETIVQQKLCLLSSSIVRWNDIILQLKHVDEPLGDDESDVSGEEEEEGDDSGDSGSHSEDSEEETEEEEEEVTCGQLSGY